MRTGGFFLCGVLILSTGGCSEGIFWQRQLGTAGYHAEELTVEVFRGDTSYAGAVSDDEKDPEIIAIVDKNATFKAISELSSQCQAAQNLKFKSDAEKFYTDLSDEERKKLEKVITNNNAACVKIHQYMFRAGVALSNDICRLYFHQADILFASNNQLNSTLVALNTLFAAGLGIASAPGAVVGAVGTGFGVAQGYSQDTINNFVFRTDVQDVYGLVVKNRDKYLNVFGKKILAIDSYYSARDLLHNYHDYCAPGRIRDQIKLAITEKSAVIEERTTLAAPVLLELQSYQQELSNELEGRPIVSQAGLIAAYAYFYLGISDPAKESAVLALLKKAAIARETGGVVELNVDIDQGEESKEDAIQVLRRAGAVAGFDQQVTDFLSGIGTTGGAAPDSANPNQQLTEPSIANPMTLQSEQPSGSVNP